MHVSCGNIPKGVKYITIGRNTVDMETYCPEGPAAFIMVYNAALRQPVSFLLVLQAQWVLVSTIGDDRQTDKHRKSKRINV